MNRSMITASVTMGQLQKRLDSISNNIANINTTGFKRREVQFGELLVQNIQNQQDTRAEVGRLTPNGIRVGTGARVAETNLKLEQGAIQQTGRELDLAITNPKQFFVIADQNGDSLFTRDGAFYLSPDPTNPELLNLVTGNGYLVPGYNGRISIPAGAENITITSNGAISATVDGVVQPIDQLTMVEVIRPQLLEQVGENLFRLPANLAELNLEPQAVVDLVDQTDIAVQQGALEASNVDMAQEMTNLLTTQRAYQFNGKSISIADQMMGLINGLR